MQILRYSLSDCIVNPHCKLLKKLLKSNALAFAMLKIEDKKNFIYLRS